MQKVLALDTLTAVRLAVAAVAALCISALFILLRLIGCRRFDAALFSILGATSAAAMFCFVLPETYPFGALSILMGLCLVAIAPYRKLSAQWYVEATEVINRQAPLTILEPNPTPELNPLSARL